MTEQLYSDIVSSLLKTSPVSSGLLKLTDKLILGDPTFEPREKGLFSKNMFSVTPGNWHVSHYELIGRPAILVLQMEDCHSPNLDFYEDCIGVDTGRVIAMPAESYEPENVDDDEWEIISSEGMFEKNGYSAYMVTSGYGDGIYPCFIAQENGRATKIIVVFIPHIMYTRLFIQNYDELILSFYHH